MKRFATKLISRSFCITLVIGTVTAEFCAAEQNAESQAISGNIDAQTFKDDYLPALQRIETFFSQVVASGTNDRTQSFPSRPTKRTKTDYVFSINGEAAKYDRNELDEDGKSSSTRLVCCRNPQKYFFVLESLGKSALHVGQLLQKDEPISDPMERYAYRYFNCAYAICGVTISDLMKDQGFHITSIQRENRGAEKLIHVSYRFKPSTPLMLRDGEFWLMPARGWVLRNWKTTLVDALKPDIEGEMEGVIDYGPSVDGVALPNHFSIKQTYGKYHSEEGFVFTQLERKEVPLDEFTLSYYGLSEADPASTNARRGGLSTRIVVIIVNAAVVVLLAIIWFWRRYRSKLESQA